MDGSLNLRVQHERMACYAILALEVCNGCRLVREDVAPRHFLSSGRAAGLFLMARRARLSRLDVPRTAGIGRGVAPFLVKALQELPPFSAPNRV